MDDLQQWPHCFIPYFHVFPMLTPALAMCPGLRKGSSKWDTSRNLNTHWSVYSGCSWNPAIPLKTRTRLLGTRGPMEKPRHLACRQPATPQLATDVGGCQVSRTTSPSNAIAGRSGALCCFEPLSFRGFDV
jgi:hypothetical protein